MSSLILLLSEDVAASPVEAELDYALISDSGMLTRHGHATLARLPKASEVVLLLPAERLSWQRIELPKPGRAMPKAKLRAVLEGLLEEQVLDDVADLHFALPAQAPGGETTWVAICRKSDLAPMLAALDQAGRTVSRIVPQAAPNEVTSLHVQGQPETARFVLVHRDGVLAAPWSFYGSLVATDWQPQHISAEPAVAELAQQALADVGSVQIVQSGQALAASLGTSWNLGQFDFNTSSQGRLWRKLQSVGKRAWYGAEWRWVRLALLLLLVVNLLGLSVWAWQMRQAISSQQQQLRQLVSQATGASYVSDQPQLQMQTKLAQLRQATGALDAAAFETMLGLLQDSPIPGGALEYADGVLTLKGAPLGPEALQTLRSKAAAAGYRVLASGDSLDIFPEAGQ